MAADITNKISKVSSGVRPVSTTVSTARNAGSTSLACADLTGWTTTEVVFFVTYKIDGSGKVIAGSQSDWVGVVTGSNINNLSLTGGTDAGNAAGDIVEMLPTAEYARRLAQWALNQHNQDGTHKSVTTDTITATTGTFTNLVVGSQTPTADWTALGSVPASVTNNGNHSQTLVFNGTDLTGTINPGTRIRTTRTVAAPTQSTSLNGTNQYWVKTSPNKLTFTDDFVISASIKPSSYATGVIASRFNGTSGWGLAMESDGRISLTIYNAGGANYSQVKTYQSVALNKWTDVAVQMDASSYTTTTITSYVMLDGVDVPVTVARGGTNPTALIQAGNLEIGSQNGGTSLFPGKIAQAAIFNSKVTQATMQGYISQGFLGTETNLASAYSFNGVATDLNTTTPNDLTAQNSASYTADSPFGTQASGLISSTLDYGIVQSATFSTNTTVIVQTPEGCTIPTSGGVSAVSYSSTGNPYGFPGDKGKWKLSSLLKTALNTTSSATYTPFAGGVWKLRLGVGAWKYGFRAASLYGTTVEARLALSRNVLTGGAANGQELTARILNSGGSIVVPMDMSSDDVIASATDYIVYSQGTTTGAGVDGGVGLTEIYAENTYL